MNKLALGLVLAFLVGGCKIEPLPPSGPSADDFERTSIGDAWLSTGGNWRIDNGALVIDHGYNHPLWLKKPIPQNAVIELDCWSNDPAGDLKVEAWGDGKSWAQTIDYESTSYVFIFGGWHNTFDVIARLNERGHDRQIRNDVHVERGKHYHWKIVRKDGQIDWSIDGKPFMSFHDKHPLGGGEHSYFAFNDWEAELHFDNFKVTPLP